MLTPIFKRNYHLHHAGFAQKQGIANAYHWDTTYPFGLSAGQLPSPNPAPPNFDLQRRKINNDNYLTVSDIQKKPVAMCFRHWFNISLIHVI
ncbi:hypothetical protein AVEN_273958-1 [Araneus ventricosus]|uniref:Uncharacterized protein n=1 Tax=Araneus ventricosus TaxID=182803 RepID=A0A4Y2VWA0_ARAVE|nr:hypothetical protein AVEN_273958-1 [Araneus ventricosus]